MRFVNLGYITIDADSLKSINLIGTRIYFIMDRGRVNSSFLHFSDASTALDVFKKINQILGIDYKEELTYNLYKNVNGEIDQDFFC